MNTSSAPRISFLILTYNQAHCIRAALESAFNQDYDNLEIVICDDHSTDQTFPILQDLVRNYHGPHPVILHQNKVNQGITANFFQAYSLASGQWLCMASGDDVFLPNRASKLMEAALLYPNAGIIASQVNVIDGQGKSYTPPQPPVFWIGASLCWHRDIMEKFPRPYLKRPPEDITLLPRTFFLGKTYVQLPDVLMNYRVDGHHYTGFKGRNTRDLQRRLIRVMTENIACLLEHRRDYAFACKQGWITEDSRILNHINQCIKTSQVRVNQAQHRLCALGGTVNEKLSFILHRQPNLPDGMLRRIWVIVGNVSWINRTKCSLEYLLPPPRRGFPSKPTDSVTLTLEDYIGGAFIYL